MNESSEKKVRFKPPPGWHPPEGTGDTLDQVCTFRKEEGGYLCMVKLGDTEMEGYEHDERSEHHKENKPDYSEMSRPMMAERGAY